MASKFHDAVDRVLEHEGGFSDHPKDPGDATNFGISLRWLKTQGLVGDVDGDGDVDAADVKALTRDQAVNLYHEKFWRPAYDSLPGQVTFKVFDLAVNAGPARAHRVLQEALNELGAGLVVDGVFGPATLAAAVKFYGKSDELLREFRAAQSTFYANLCIESVSLRAFLRGWMRRAAA